MEMCGQGEKKDGNSLRRPKGLRPSGLPIGPGQRNHVPCPGLAWPWQCAQVFGEDAEIPARGWPFFEAKAKSKTLSRDFPKES